MPLEVVADFPRRMRLFCLRCQITRLQSVHIKSHYSQNAFDSALLAWYERGISLPCGPNTSSISVAVLGFPCYRRKKKKKVLNGRLYDLIIGPILLPSQVFFHVGEQEIVRWCQIRWIWRVINQFKATVMQSSHCNHRLVGRNIVLVKQDSLCQFSMLSPKRSLVLLFKELSELLIQCGYIWKETMQLVSGKVAFNACQVSLLLHNSLVSLWTFQPALVNDIHDTIFKLYDRARWQDDPLHFLNDSVISN